MSEERNIWMFESRDIQNSSAVGASLDEGQSSNGRFAIDTWAARYTCNQCPSYIRFMCGGGGLDVYTCHGSGGRKCVLVM